MTAWMLGWCTLLAVGTPLPELVEHHVQHQARPRQYHVHYPGNQRPTRPLPAMIVLHGGGGAPARRLAEVTGFNRLADREQFLVVYPAAVDGHWNDGRGQVCGLGLRAAPTADDVGFITRVIDELTTRGDADPRRLYVTGFSNGGMMTHRLGIELGHRLAAIAPVIANLPAALADRPPARPLPVLIMNGTDDPMVPWHGGPVRVFGRACGDVLSTRQTINFWLRAGNRAATEPKRETWPDRDPTDGCRVEIETYGDPHGPSPVLLVTVHGGGHTIPGGGPARLPRLVGRQCRDIEAARVIWDFCRAQAVEPGR